MLRTNVDKLVNLLVEGVIASPTLRQSYRIWPLTGEPVQLPSVGGISYNANLGDPAVGLMADHIEPGVSIGHPHEASNRALNTFACLGNVARVISGDGKGLTGFVSGKHGGVDHVMIHFPNLADLDKLSLGDRIAIRSFGSGLQLPDHPDVTVMNLDPAMLPMLEARAETLVCPVTHQVPAQLLGAGLGEDSCRVGDVDIQLFDDDSVSAYGLNTLRFGDLVAMMDTDHRYGRIYRQGWLSVGVVTHSCSIQAGHGPGLTTILTGPTSALAVVPDPQANVIRYLP